MQETKWPWAGVQWGDQVAAGYFSMVKPVLLASCQFSWLALDKCPGDIWSCRDWHQLYPRLSLP